MTRFQEVCKEFYSAIEEAVRSKGAVDVLADRGYRMARIHYSERDTPTVSLCIRVNKKLYEMPRTLITPSMVIAAEMAEVYLKFESEQSNRDP